MWLTYFASLWDCYDRCTGKVLPITFVLCFLLSCQRSENVDNFVIGFSQCTTEDVWRIAMHDEMKRELAFYPEVELIIKNAENSSEKQITQINELISSGIDLLIVSPNEVDPITPLVEEIFYKGIPVIIVDRRINSDIYTSYVGSDNYEIGKSAGEYASEILDGRGNIIEISGLKGSSPAINRSRGFIEGISDYSDIQVIAEIDGQWEKEYVALKLPTVLEKFPQVDLIYAHNDRMALGAYKWVKEAGLTAVKILGIDGLPGPNGGITLVEDGILTATFLYPTGGKEAISTAMKILHNDPYQKENLLSSLVIDSSNVRVMKLQTDKILSQQKDIERQSFIINRQLRSFRSQRVLFLIVLLFLSIVMLQGGLAFRSIKQKQKMYEHLNEKNQRILSLQHQMIDLSERAYQSNRSKLKGLMGISNKFRTHLMRILTPVDELLHATWQNSSDLEDLTLVRKDVGKLLNLVNQLVENGKNDIQQINIQPERNNLSDFIRELIEVFAVSAKEKNVGLTFEYRGADSFAYFDPYILDKVIFNFLFNMLHVTSEGGNIRIKIFTNESKQEAVVSIIGHKKQNSTNSPVEMSSEDISLLFNKGTDKDLEKKLGFTLSREIVELHQGSLKIFDELQDGMRFFISLPIEKPKNKHEQIPASLNATHRGPDASHTVFLNQHVEEYLSQLLSNGKFEYLHSSVLIIGENEELRQLLTTYLGKIYNTVEIENTLKGLSVAHDEIPDLIICDIDPQKKSGIALLKKLKEDDKTSHIPVILLTSGENVELQIEGIKKGADTSISKPINFNILFATIENLLRNRELQRKHFTKYTSNSNRTVAKLSDHLIIEEPSRESEFVQRFINIVENNYTDSNFSVNDISEELCMSRVQLYRKVKALLNCSVNDFIVTTRLEKAKQLLTKGNLTISQIAYEVGFSSPSYFSTAFKAKHGISPSQIKPKNYSS